MTTPIERFITTTERDIVDLVREDAARVCDETARFMRGERRRVRNPADDGIYAEFSDAAFGVASEVAISALDAFKRAGLPFSADYVWDTAAALLRGGWSRGCTVDVRRLPTKAKA